MKIEKAKIYSIRQDPNNARAHNERNLTAIMESLKRFGQMKPLVVTADGIVIAGNGTLTAAQRLGWGSVEIVRVNLSPEEARAYGIVDNRLNELSDWDTDALMRSIEALSGADGLVDLLGFDDPELDEMFAPAAGDQPARERMQSTATGAATVRIVLRVSDVAKVEQALAATGNPNRAEALLEICDGWQKRQLHVHA